MLILALALQKEQLDAPSQPLQQTLKNLDRALRDAFNKKSPKRFPRFKKKGMGGSCRYPQGFKVDEADSRVFLPKIGWLKYRNSRLIEGTAKNMTLSQSGDSWFVFIQTEYETTQAVHKLGSIIRLDMGVAKFATLSDGTICRPVNCYRKGEKMLKQAQRLLSRMLGDDFQGYINTSKYAKLAKCSNDTALRDIQDLKERGLLIQNPGMGRSTSYRIAYRVKRNAPSSA